jgi:hypothetical protein
VCNDFGGGTIFVSRPPNEFIGYKDLDLQFTKDVDLPYNSSGYVRVDVLNVFNWANYDPGAVFYPSYDVAPQYNKTGPIVGTPFMVKLSAGLRFGDRSPSPVVEAAPPPPPPPPPETQTCADGSVIAVDATCPVPPPPPPPPPAPVERGERGQ